jgi:hypothetical protein
MTHYSLGLGVGAIRIHGGATGRLLKRLQSPESAFCDADRFLVSPLRCN